MRKIAYDDAAFIKTIANAGSSLTRFCSGWIFISSFEISGSRPGIFPVT